ncbi:SAM-dependent methyltransferase, partial [Actinacidiphila bryophytorum]
GRMTNDHSGGAPLIDTSLPHSARMYDYWLGGSNNFAADRAMGQAIEQAIPGIKAMAMENRKFLGRAVRHMAGEAGIRQFLDIGTGIPADGDTASVAALVAPDSRVVCVDNDPIVQAHARDVLNGRPGAGRTVYLEADLREPAEILGSPLLKDTIDLGQPVGLLLVAILMLVKDEQDPWGAVGAFLDAMPSGSHVAISHPTQDFDPEAMAEVTRAAEQGRMTLVPRDRSQVLRFFADWEIISPGLVPVMAWRPEAPLTEDERSAYYWAAVARKP